MMKLISRIMHLIVAASALVATILLFSLSPLSFNSKVVVDVETISKLVPETTYTKDIDAKELLGTDEIQVGVKFKLSLGDVNKAKNGDKEVMNERLLKGNMDDVLNTLDEAVDVLADHSIRRALKSTIATEITNTIERAKPAEQTMTTAQIMETLDINDKYFENFANALYNEADRNNATADSVGAVLQEQTGEALMKVEKAGMVKSGTYTEDQKTAVKENLEKILDQLDMVNEDGTIKPVSDLPYLYTIKHIQKELSGKVSDSELSRKSGETTKAYSNRLLETYVFNIMPDAFYNVVKYISLGISISVYVLVAIWLALAAYQVLLFFFPAKQFGLFKGLLIPFFAIAGLIQIVLGFVLTGVFKYVLPSKLDIASMKLPIKDAIIVPRTFALGTSIVLIVTIGLLIASMVIRKIAFSKKEEKAE